jgi:hypothetical protein
LIKRQTANKKINGFNLMDKIQNCRFWNTGSNPVVY